MPSNLAHQAREMLREVDAFGLDSSDRCYTCHGPSMVLATIVIAKHEEPARCVDCKRLLNEQGRAVKGIVLRVTRPEALRGEHTGATPPPSSDHTSAAGASPTTPA